MDALGFLERKTKAKPARLMVLAGDEDFLKRQALSKLTSELLGDADPEFALTSYEGEKASWPAVKAELDTLPFLSPRRIVVIEQADKFVTLHRTQLEQYGAAESGPGTLILDVKSWPANTKLAKQTPDAATVTCKSPSDAKVKSWCKAWCHERYKKNLPGDAVDWLVELVGPSLGMLDQELAKLSAFAGDSPSITREQIESLVTRSRQAETFKIFDAIGGGRSAEAAKILHRLLEAGEEPMAILGAFSWQMRRLAAVSRATRAGLTLSAAMDRVGVPPFARAGVEQQLRHLGRARMDRIYDWLLETDLGMKGSSSLSPRILIERLLVLLARPDTPAASK